MKLTFNDNQGTGDINVPITGITTNEQMAEAILKRYKPDFKRGVSKCTNEVKEYVKTLLNDPNRLFIDPCYEVEHMEDLFVCSFEFES